MSGIARKTIAKPKKTSNGWSQDDKLSGPSGLVRDATGRIVEYYSEDDICPICKSDRYLNPNLRLLVSRCYHKLCESCIDRIFTLGTEPCPTCGTMLRKNNFSPQTFENLGVEKEVVIRKMVAKSFNKREKDFATIKDYNNYLEEVEDIVFNLVNGVDVIQTEAKLKRLQAQNQAIIQQNNLRDARASELQRRRDATERQDREQRRAQLMEMEMAALAEDAELKGATIEGLANSDEAASAILQRQRLAVRRKLANRSKQTGFDDTSLRPSFAGLLDGTAADRVTEPVDTLADLANYDDYSTLFEASAARVSLQDEMSCYEGGKALVDPITSIGGFSVVDVRGRLLRSAVMALFTPLVTEAENLALNNTEITVG